MTAGSLTLRGANPQYWGSKPTSGRDTKDVTGATIGTTSYATLISPRLFQKSGIAPKKLFFIFGFEKTVTFFKIFKLPKFVIFGRFRFLLF